MGVGEHAISRETLDGHAFCAPKVFALFAHELVSGYDCRAEEQPHRLHFPGLDEPGVDFLGFRFLVNEIRLSR